MKLENIAVAILTCLSLCAGLAGGASAETIKIEVIAALTGPGAPWGMAAAEGPRILAAEINANGGLDVSGEKYDVEIIAYDDQYNAADAVAAYNRLVNNDGVKYMIIMSSAATMALKQNVEDDEVVALTSAASSNAIDENTRYMFRLYSTPTEFVPGFVAWLRDNVQQRRLVIINPNDETGWDFVKLSEKLFGEAGFEVLGSELFERSQTDFQGMITKIMGMDPDVIELATTSPASAGLIVRQARELGYKGLFVKSSGPSPREIVESAGREAAEGMINLLYADRGTEGYQRVAAEYTKSVGQEPNEMVVTFYDAANVLLHAIQKAGDAEDTSKVRDAFTGTLPMPSVQGDEMKLGGKSASGVDQQILTVDYIGVIRDGEPVVVGKIEPAN